MSFEYELLFDHVPRALSSTSESSPDSPGACVVTWAIGITFIGMLTACVYFGIKDNLCLDASLPTFLRPKRARS